MPHLAICRAYGQGAGYGLGAGLGWPGYWYKSNVPKGRQSQGSSKKFGVEHPWGYGLGGYYGGLVGPWGGYFAAPYGYGLGAFPGYGFFPNPSYYGGALFRSGVPKSNEKKANRRENVAKRFYGYGAYAPFAAPAGFGYPGWANYGHPGLGFGVPAFGSFSPYLGHYPFGSCFYKSKITKGEKSKRAVPDKADKKCCGVCGGLGGCGYGLPGGCGGCGGCGGLLGGWGGWGGYGGLGHGLGYGGGYGLGYGGFGHGGWGWGGYPFSGWGYGGFGGWGPGCGSGCGFYKSQISENDKAKQSETKPKRETGEEKPEEDKPEEKLDENAGSEGQ